MPDYRAEVPILIASSQRNDRLGFQTSWGAKIDAQLEYDGLHCRLTTLEGGRVNATFGQVRANSQGEAYVRVCHALAIVVPWISLEIQRDHIDRHYGPIRALWSRSSLQVTPADEWPATSVAMHARKLVTLANAGAQLATVAATPELQSLLLSYDRALAPDDDESRFFNAFAIIEFVEGRYARGDRFPALLDDADATALVDAMRACALERALDAGVVQRVGDLVTGRLGAATIEGRNTKLLTVLRETFGITSIEDATGALEVDLDLVRHFTGARNRLFHGAARADAARFARLTDHLTLVVEAIIRALLDNRVPIQPPAA